MMWHRSNPTPPLPSLGLLLLLPTLGCGQHLDSGNVCRLATLLPFTDERPGLPPPHGGDPAATYGYGDWPDAASLAGASFSLLAAAHLAVRHFNARDGSVVPELAAGSLLDGCDVRLSLGDDDDREGGSPWVFDSGHSRARTVSQALPLVASDPAGTTGGGVCAFLGPIDVRAHEGLSVLSEHADVPQVGFATVGQRLGRTDDHPTFLRTIPAAYDFSDRIATLVGRDVWKREYVAIIYDQSDYGEQFEDPLEDAEDELGYATVTEHFVEGDPDSLYSSLGEAKDKGFKTVLLVTDRPGFLEEIANVAEELGMLGDEDFMWIISGDAFPPAMRGRVRHEVDSPIDKMLRGAALFTNYDPFVYRGEDDPFLRAWRTQDGALAEEALASQPLDGDGNRFYAPDDAATYFQTETPAEFASFLYDSVVTAGIGACRAQRSAGDGGERGSHYRGMRAAAFRGASGEFRFAEGTNARDPRGTLYGAYNVRPGPVDDDSKRRSYEAVLTATWDVTHATNSFGEEVSGGAWRTVPGEEFVFYDGTTEQPLPLRAVADEHLLSDGVQVAGLFLSSFAVFTSVCTGVFVAAKRKNKHIRSIQPEFCLILCVGAGLVAASLIFVSFDESDGFSNEELDSMCTSAPWFFVIGYLTMFSALFTKLWRLSKVLSIRRQQVRIKQVMAPFVLIIMSSLVVLTVWTIVDPVVWERKPLSGLDDEGEKNTDEPLETYGRCTSEKHSVIPFVSTLAFLFAIVIGVTAVFSWKLKGVSTDFADSKLVFFGISLHIEVWMVGVSKDAFYLMLTAVTFIFSMSMVAVVIWPKIYLYFRDTYFGEPKSSGVPPIGVNGTAGVHISGLSTSPESLRLKELEHQVSRLKTQLDERDSMIRTLSTRGGSIQQQMQSAAEPQEKRKSEEDYERFESLLEKGVSCTDTISEEVE